MTKPDDLEPDDWPVDDEPDQEEGTATEDPTLGGAADYVDDGDARDTDDDEPDVRQN